MSFARSAPTRRPEPEFPESDFPASPASSETPEKGPSILVYLRLLWHHRRMLLRVLVMRCLRAPPSLF